MSTTHSPTSPCPGASPREACVLIPTGTAATCHTPAHSPAHSLAHPPVPTHLPPPTCPHPPAVLMHIDWLVYPQGTAGAWTAARGAAASAAATRRSSGAALTSPSPGEVRPPRGGVTDSVERRRSELRVWAPRGVTRDSNSQCPEPSDNPQHALVQSTNARLFSRFFHGMFGLFKEDGRGPGRLGSPWGRGDLAPPTPEEGSWDEDPFRRDTRRFPWDEDERYHGNTDDDNAYHRNTHHRDIHRGNTHHSNAYHRDTHHGNWNSWASDIVPPAEPNPAESSLYIGQLLHFRFTHSLWWHIFPCRFVSP